MPPIPQAMTHDDIINYTNVFHEDPEELFESRHMTVDERYDADIYNSLNASVSKQAYQPINLRKDIKGLKYLKEFSDDETAFYKDKNNNIFVGVRGTTTLFDTLNDLIVASGAVGDLLLLPESNNPFYKRVKHTEELINKVLNKYPNAKIEIAGHSLGASISEAIGRKNLHYNVKTFNKLALLPKLGDIYSYPNIKEYRIGGDIFSASTFNKPTILNAIVPDREIREAPSILRTLEEYSPFKPRAEIIYEPHHINQFISREKKEKLDKDYYPRRIASAFGGIVSAVATPFIPNPFRNIVSNTMREAQKQIKAGGITDLIQREKLIVDAYERGLYNLPFSAKSFQSASTNSKKIIKFLDNPFMRMGLGGGVGEISAGLLYDTYF